ncbi:MAG TPA: hypothetical protein VL524_19930 [Gemmatimonadaceae bacterium]|jgi:hypothetical protein|nr:hypothetical protein [Gemmatimonadaceae bacterium]
MARRDVERQVSGELEAWRARAVPDAAAPLESDDLVRLLRDLVAELALDPAIASEFTVNTVHYYRRKDIIDPPEGRTVASRYGIRHLWQIAGARLAGYLGLVTLAEARAAMRGADDEALLEFVASRVADARARALVRSPASVASGGPAAPRALPRAGAATMIQLPGDAWAVVPASHAAHRSPEAARALARALASALENDKTR